MKLFRLFCKLNIPKTRLAMITQSWNDYISIRWVSTMLRVLTTAILSNHQSPFSSSHCNTFDPFTIETSSSFSSSIISFITPSSNPYHLAHALPPHSPLTSNSSPSSGRRCWQGGMEMPCRIFSSSSSVWIENNKDNYNYYYFLNLIDYLLGIYTSLFHSFIQIITKYCVITNFQQ